MDINISMFLWIALGILLFALCLCVPIVCIVAFVRTFLKLKKLNQPITIVYFILMLVCVVIMIPSWIFNLGWIRVFLTMILFPIVHLVAFVIINISVLKKLHLSAKLKTYTALSYVSFVFAYLLFPDAGDVGTMYFFFGLIHNDVAAYIAMIAALVCFVAHVVCTILQLGEVKK